MGYTLKQRKRRKLRAKGQLSRGIPTSSNVDRRKPPPMKFQRESFNRPAPGRFSYL